MSVLAVLSLSTSNTITGFSITVAWRGIGVQTMMASG
jgi:hypothetical protein